MSFFDYLERLRARPERERRLILFWSTTLITLFILILWFVNLKITLSTPTETPTLAVASSTPEVGTSFGQILSEAKLRIQTGWQTITNQN